MGSSQSTTCGEATSAATSKHHVQLRRKHTDTHSHDGEKNNDSFGYSHEVQASHDGDSDDQDEDNHLEQSILSDSMNDVHCHDELYDHFSDTYHFNQMPHDYLCHDHRHHYHHHELSPCHGWESTFEPCGQEEELLHHHANSGGEVREDNEAWHQKKQQEEEIRSGHAVADGKAVGEDNERRYAENLHLYHQHHHQQHKHPSIGSTIQAMTDRFFGSSHHNADTTDEETISLALRIFDHAVELSFQGESMDSLRGRQLEYQTSKATLRLAMATLAERRRDEEHLDHGSAAGSVSQFDGKPLWSFLRAKHLSITEQWSKMFHRSYFYGYQTVRNLSSAQEFHRVVDTGVLQGYTAKAIYSNEHGLDTMKKELHQTAVVDEGRTGNIRWCITEGQRHRSEFYNDEHHQDEELNVLTVTFRGCTLQDPKVDTEQLLLDTASANPMKLTENVIVHSGLYKAVKQIYDTIKPHLLKHKRDDQKIVICGHSLGGTSSNLILMMLTLEKGAEWVMTHVLRVFTYGAPPVLRYVGSGPYPQANCNSSSKEDHEFFCPILASVGLPASMVYGYVQPWDPIPRMFSEIDAFHHAIDDVGKDGVTLLASGSFRMAQIFAAAAVRKCPVSWQKFRDTFRECAHQHYQSVGIQHLLMPRQRQYFCDLFAHVDLRRAHIHSVLRLDGSELYSALYDTFPLDSYVVLRTSTLIRSILHHNVGSYASRFHVYQDLVSPKVHSYGEQVPKSSWLPKDQ